MPDLIRTLALAALLAVPAALLAGPAYTTKTVNLRAGPDRSYPLVASLAPGVLVDVDGCVDGYTWCDVTAGPYQGWVYGGNLTTPYEDQRVPLLGYGAAIGLPIVVFSVGSYWDSHYRGRPFYRERDRWVNRPPMFRPPPRPSPGRPDFRPPHRPDYRPPGRPDYRPPGRPDYRPPGRPEGRPPGRPDARPPGRPEGRPPGRPEGRPPGGGGNGNGGRPGGGDRPGR